MEEELTIREMRPEERRLLKDFLYEAIFVPEGAEKPPREIVDLPELSVYTAGFGEGEADTCLVAIAKGEPVGAAWGRIMRDYGHVDERTPSLAVALRKEFRSRGIGTRLLTMLLERLADKGYRQASLSVQKANPAFRLYQRLGFATVKESEEERVMVRKLKE